VKLLDSRLSKGISTLSTTQLSPKYSSLRRPSPRLARAVALEPPRLSQCCYTRRKLRCTVPCSSAANSHERRLHLVVCHSTARNAKVRLIPSNDTYERHKYAAEHRCLTEPTCPSDTPRAEGVAESTCCQLHVSSEMSVGPCGRVQLELNCGMGMCVRGAC